jgi:hypothetical protein
MQIQSAEKDNRKVLWQPSNGDNIKGPSLIKVPHWIAPEERAEPQANYYPYFANQRGNCIRMAWAENLPGPYIDQGRHPEKTHQHIMMT